MRTLFWIFFFLVINGMGCASQLLEKEFPLALSEEDVKIKKALSPKVIEFGLGRIPHPNRLEIKCWEAQKVEGLRRLILGHATERLEYSPWRELVEIPILAPLNLAFLPFYLIGWAFGSETAKQQVWGTLYYLNPGQNGPIWGGEIKIEKKKGKYIGSYSVKKGEKKPLQWVHRRSIPFLPVSAKLNGTSLSVPPSKAIKEWVILLPRDHTWKEPCLLELEGEARGQKVSSRIIFIFDDTPMLAKKPAKGKALQAGKIFYKIAGHHYQRQEYKKALENYHHVIQYFRYGKQKTSPLDPYHPFVQAYLFRGLSRLRIYTPDLKHPEKVPLLPAWRAMIDLQTFLKLAPFHKDRQYAETYLKILAKLVLAKKEKWLQRMEEKNQKKNTLKFPKSVSPKKRQLPQIPQTGNKTENHK
ncbi:MAG: hypothetical protein D6785_02780 [Planctomycetota bacterium]|nr:MAG: hypothetical protein D6785_02780 [Planctomycetota bacterium]